MRKNIVGTLTILALEANSGVAKIALAMGATVKEREEVLLNVAAQCMVNVHIAKLGTGVSAEEIAPLLAPKIIETYKLMMSHPPSASFIKSVVEASEKPDA